MFLFYFIFSFSIKFNQPYNDYILILNYSLQHSNTRSFFQLVNASKKKTNKTTTTQEPKQHKQQQTEKRKYQKFLLSSVDIRGCILTIKANDKHDILV